MNPSPTFWRDFFLVLLAIAVLMLIGGVIEMSADALLGTTTDHG